MLVPIRLLLSLSVLITLGLITGGWLGVGAAPSPHATHAWTGEDRGEVRGSVVDEVGEPVLGVRVELVIRERLVGSATTEADGRFQILFSADVLRALGSPTSGEVRAQRLGYHAAVQSVELPDPGEVLLVLRPAPLPLPGMRVDGGPTRCEGDDADGLARLLWEAAASRHPGGVDTLGIASYMSSLTDTVDGEARAPVRSPDGATAEEGVGRPEAGQRGSAPILRLGWGRRIDRQGYAFPVRRTDREGSYASWSYAPLESDLASHFGAPQFGEMHYFQMISAREDGWLVRFCAQDRDRPHIDGRIELTADTLIRRADWSFRTDPPVENAGGWALFPAPEGSPPPLLPLESMAWRTLRETTTIRRAQWFDGWILAPGDSVPFLPRRAKEAEGSR
ncbi:MAG: carboxypeptidase-like regulatory domain-containing protein [Gemmatimonadota bacterium]